MCFAWPKAHDRRLFAEFFFVEQRNAGTAGNSVRDHGYLSTPLRKVKALRSRESNSVYGRIPSILCYNARALVAQLLTASGFIIQKTQVQFFFQKNNLL